MNKCLLAAGLVLAGNLCSTLLRAAGSAEPGYTVIINNVCRRDIRVAVHYQHPQLGWITQGWWNVPGQSEVDTGLRAVSSNFYMHGTSRANLQWPPKRSRKQYKRYPVLEADFVLEADAQVPESAEQTPFSLKQISPASPGLKARFDC